MLLAIFFGAALGNVIRGVPLSGDRFFFEPLWTHFLPSGQTGILDWYTVLTGVVALAALTVHGANYIALKTTGDLQMRARRMSRLTGWIFTVLIIAGLLATLRVRPQLMASYQKHVWGFLIPLIVIAGISGMHYFRMSGRDLPAFLSFSACLAGMLGGAAFGLYPNVLPSTLGEEYNLTIWNSSAQPYGLKIGVIWWAIGTALAIIYFTYLFRSYRGKVALEEEPS